MARKKANPNAVPIEGWALTSSERKRIQTAADQGHKASKTMLINDKYSHLGLSVPRPVRMTDATNTVVQNVTATDKRGKPTAWENKNVVDKTGKAKTGLSKYFVHPETGKLTSDVHDLEGLHADPQFQQMVQRHLRQVKKNVAAGYTDKALAFYPLANSKLSQLGESFNAQLEKQGKPKYFPDQPELGGALLATAYSKGNSEANRFRMVNKVVDTGELPDWNGAREDVQRALSGNVHPLDLWNAKLRDFAGSQLFPGTWAGEHNGKKLGSGFTVDRHVNNVSSARQFGELRPGLSGKEGSINDRRYRVQQEALNVAHQTFDPEGHLSRPAFQSLAWAGHDSAEHYQAPEGR